MSSEIRIPVAQQQTVEGLWRAVRDRRLAHALGFFGPAGVGKFLAAKWFALGLFCEDDSTPRPGPPCGRCGPCKRFLSGSHPDYYVLDPAERGLELIRVQHVVDRDGDEGESIESFLRLKPAEGGYRVVIVRDFDRAVAQAQNALLKTLEEPGESVVLVLETSSPDRLLDTVKSRCVTVPFDRLWREDATGVLTGLGLPMDEADELARWSRGAPGRAFELHELGAANVREILEAVLRGGDPLLAVANYQALDVEHAGDTPTKKARAKARFFLELALDVISDLMRAAAGVPRTELAHGDLASLAQDFDPTFAAGPLRTALDALLSARQDVDQNLTPDAAVERALFALSAIGVSQQEATK